MTQYNVVLADPPWPFSDKLKGVRRDLDRFYKPMYLEQIKSYHWEAFDWGENVIGRSIAKDAAIFLWTPNAMLREGIEVLAAWSFDYKTNMVWIKPKMGMGHYVRGAHETILIGTRGSLERKFKGQPSWFFAPVQDHSHKPEELYDIIERLYDGPYLELFARRRRVGWDAIGDQLDA